MKVRIDNELFEICKEIVGLEKNTAEWAVIESSDMFQSSRYSGGFDSIENAFCFSFYDESDNEYWFQLSLQDIEDIVNLKKKMITVNDINA